MHYTQTAPINFKVLPPRTLPEKALLPMIVLALCLSMISACTPKTAPPLSDAQSAAKATAAWRAFADRSEKAAAGKGPYRMIASLRYDNNNEGHRVTGYLWGNGDARDKYGATSLFPIRLDLISSVGTSVAKIREDEKNFIAYDPNDNKAYTYDEENRALTSFGVPVPFDLSALVLLLNGRYAEFFMPDHEEGNWPQPEFIRFAPEDGVVFNMGHGELEIGPDGMPRRWEQHRASQGKTGWIMEITPSPKASSGPLRVSLTHPEGYEAVITVKERTRPDRMFKTEQLNLDLPKDVKLEAISS